MDRHLPLLLTTITLGTPGGFIYGMFAPAGTLPKRQLRVSGTFHFHRMVGQLSLETLRGVRARLQQISSISGMPAPSDILTLSNIKLGGAHYVKFSPDGQTVVTVGTQEGNVSFWDAHTRQLLGILGQKLQDLEDLAFSRDGRTLVASHDNENSFDFYFWDVRTRRHITTLQMRSGDFALSPVGEILATPVGQEACDFWDVRTHQRITTLRSPEFSFAFTSYLTFSPDGQTLAAVVWESTGGQAVYFWDVTMASDADTAVKIPDPKLRSAIEGALGKTSGATITRADMLTLTELGAYRGIQDLTGIEFATNLTKLGLKDNEISDVSALGSLTNLT